jgi:hypothetical protein
MDVVRPRNPVIEAPRSKRIVVARRDQNRSRNTRKVVFEVLAGRVAGSLGIVQIARDAQRVDMVSDREVNRPG